MGLVAAAVEGDLSGIQRFAVGCGFGERYVSVADGILNAALHINVGCENAGNWGLLSGEFGEFGDVELRGVELNPYRTGLGEGPLV